MGAEALRVEDLPHYTYDDYVQWEGRWEIIHGIPYAMTPSPRVRHQALSQKISLQLGMLLGNCSKCQVLCTMDWPVTEDTVVQPDILVVCGNNIGDTKLEVTPVLIVEILSPSTSHKDTGLKYRLYEQAGVNYYCIVDPDTNSAEVYVLQKDTFQKTDPFTENGILFDLGPCQITFNFVELFTP